MLRLTTAGAFALALLAWWPLSSRWGLEVRTPPGLLEVEHGAAVEIRAYHPLHPPKALHYNLTKPEADPTSTCLRCRRLHRILLRQLPPLAWMS
jgi:hypothetical protein